jgi:D-3-phosphoglycerate dehydrogenase
MMWQALAQPPPPGKAAPGFFPNDSSLSTGTDAAPRRLDAEPPSRNKLRAEQPGRPAPGTGGLMAPLRIAILDDYQRVALGMADWRRLGPDVEFVPFDRPLGVPDEAAAALADFDVLVMMRERMRIPRALIERLPRLKLMVMTGSQSQSIDFAAAADRGIPVCSTTGKPSRSAAELAWLLVLAAARHLPEEDRNMRRGGWMTTVGTGLQHKTLGLLGLGVLGGVVAGYGRAFGMDVIAWSANLTAERAAAVGATLVEKDELLQRADVISIHLKLSGRTRGLVGAREFGLMKPSAILVNTSRGPIIDEAAMIEALRSRRIRAAGLDVFDEEPLPAGHPLRSLDNAVLTPHLGYVTEEGYRNLYGGAVDVIEAWRGGTIINQYHGFDTR